MNAVELIRKKRNGSSLTTEELSFFMSSYIRGDLPDYQMSAFLMACYFRGMDEEESKAFTELMLHSGTVLDLSDIPGAKVDKHSTGGVADTVSLLLAPIVASCGVRVPMISGRGLGHTGGTLDKLESIPGFRTDLDIAAFRKVLSEVGVSMIGQTDDIAPADRKLYALRDVTATIESPPLIAGSIMSKKLAAGIDALVLDIKCGNGAFMDDPAKAEDLAKRLVDIGERAGKRTVAYITDMNQPLGSRIGNWFEIEETVRCLRGEQDELNRDLLSLTHLLAGTMLFLGGAAKTVGSGTDMSRKAVADGSALATFRSLITAHHGDPASIDPPGPHPPCPYSLTITAEQDGFVHTIETREVGMCSVLLGAGRLSLTDKPDPVAGIILSKRRGMAVQRGEPIATLFASDENRLDAVSGRLRRAFRVDTSAPPAEPLVRSVVTKDGVRPYDGGSSSLQR